VDFKQERLDSIDSELMQAKTVLVDITDSRRLCLQELGLRKNFVMWVKEALEGNQIGVCTSNLMGFYYFNALL